MSTWYATNPGVVPPGYTPGTPGDVCPTVWTEDADRSQMSTEVLIGRTLPSNIPDLAYTLGSGSVTTGEIVVVGPNQIEATALNISRASVGGANQSAWLDYLNVGSNLKITVVDDPTKSLGYQVSDDPTFHSGYIAVPVAWRDGITTLDPGPVTLSISLGPEPPLLYWDDYGRDVYGRETFVRTDLINATRSLFETLADRILEVRGSNSIPRVDTVGIDARTGRDFPMQNMELMSTVRPEKPSRYAIALEVDGRLIYDRMMFATSVRHTIERDEWSTQITLDVAEWAGVL